MPISIRKAVSDDADITRQLYYDTINTVNHKHYNEAQVAAWSAGYTDAERWVNKIRIQHFMVAETDAGVAGFASLTDDGYLDLMFVHAEHQGQGVATLLFNCLQGYAQSLQISLLTTHASITARPFFEKRGFSVVKQQTVTVRGVNLINYVMEKTLNLAQATN